MSADVQKMFGRAARRRRGLTLIEAAMVLVILALVIGGVMLYYQSASTGQRTTEAAGQVASIQQAVRAMYAGQSSYTGLVNTDIQGSLPAKMTSAGAIRHAFNGAVTVAPATVGGASDGYFTIQFDNVPLEACSRLAALDYGRGVVSLQYGNGTVDYASGGRVTPAQAQTNCNQTASKATMIWTVN